MMQLVVLMGVVLWASYLWSAIRTKELAIRAGALHCQKLGVQFLDETVVLKRIRLTRDPRSNPVWARVFNFEFATDGRFRYEGRIFMYGQRLHRIEMDPYPEQAALGHTSDSQTS